MSLRAVAILALFAILCSPVASLSSERVGEAVRIKTDVTGSTGPIAVKGPVYRDERIRTSSSGLGQFVFTDGTKLAVGWGSSVVIDKFVFDDSRSVKKLTIKAAKGTFRWISGNSKSSGPSPRRGPSPARASSCISRSPPSAARSCCSRKS